MTRLATRAEVAKLSRTLGADPATLAFLERLPAEQVRELRRSVYDRYYTFDRKLFQRVTRAFRRIPSLIGAWIARLAGPLLTARVAGDLPARHAARMAQRLPPAFVADVCLYLDPRCAHDLIHALPTRAILPIALELLQRRDWITTGRFVDFLPDDAIRTVLEHIENDEMLLRISFFVESPDRLDHVVHLMPAERLRQAILLAVDESRDLLTEVMSLIIHVSYALKRELGDLAAAQDESVLDRVVEATHAQRLWTDLLPVISVVSPEAQRKVVNLPILRNDPGVLQAILTAAHEGSLWGEVLPLIRHMDEPMRAAVARIAADLPSEALSGAADAALLGEHWEVLLDVARRIPPPRQREWARIVSRYGEVDPQLLERLQRRAAELGFGDAFVQDDAVALVA
jgi:hypothetical protein